MLRLLGGPRAAPSHAAVKLALSAHLRTAAPAHATHGSALADLPESMVCVQIRIVGGNGGPEALERTNLPLPWDQLGPGDVMIKVAAAGVNRPDVLQRRGLYPAPPGHSPVPGLEVAGVVCATGKADGAGLQIGDAVLALTNGGGYAEYAVAPAAQCLPVPQPLSTVQAACVPETFFTVYHNIFQQVNVFGEALMDKPTPSLLVHGGSSGIGTTAIQMCAARGVRVFATAGTDEKCAACEGLGAARCINYNTEQWDEWLLEETDGRGVDVVLDMVCGSYLQRNLGVLGEQGRLAIIGSHGGYEPPKGLSLLQVMRRRLTVGGSTLRARSTAIKGAIAQGLLADVWPLIGDGRITVPVHATFPLANAADAHRLMESSQHIGKIALVTDYGARRLSAN